MSDAIYLCGSICRKKLGGVRHGDSPDERQRFKALAVEKVLTAPIFKNLRNFKTKDMFDKTAKIKLIDLLKV